MSNDEVMPPITLAELQREYLDDLRHRVSNAHYRNVAGRLAMTVAALDVARADALHPLAVIRYRNRLQAEGLSNRSANLVADNLRTMLTWACECGLLDTNPLAKVRRLPDSAGHQRCVRRALSEDEIARFLAAAEADDGATSEAWRARGGGRADRRRRASRVPQGHFGGPFWRRERGGAS